jgi:phospholipid/cholesterol/gamma-HCH transport system substrate-binding protein
MNTTREQVWVGAFVLVAVGLVMATVLSVSGAFGAKGNTHRTYFKYAAGLSPAATVRYGGLLAGKVEKVRVDPQDVNRIEIEFRVDRGIPLKTNSVAKISALGALGESYLELSTGTNDAPAAAPGSVIPSQETVAIADLGNLIAGLTPIAKETLENLHARLGEMQTTIARVNDLLGDTNRQNIGRSLATLDAMLRETRPKLAATLGNLQAASDRFPAVSKNVLDASERMAPLLDDLRNTNRQARDTLSHLDAVVVENRTDIRASVLEARRTLETAGRAVELLRSALDRNTDNLDDTLINVRAATDNLREMTDTIKRKPSVLIRGETGKDRQPGATK